MKLYFIRHASTNSNEQRISMGKRIDEPINENGIKEAKELAKKLPRDFDVLISSPMKRAFQTAEIISQELGLPIEVREELTERDFGALSGLKWEEIEKITGGKVRSAINPHLFEYDFGKFGAETAEQLEARLKTFVAWVKNKYGEKKVLVVGHGGHIRAMYAFYKGMRPQKMENVSMHEIEV